MRIIEKTKIWFSISLIIIIIGVGLIATRGLNIGIDFKGGTKLVFEMGANFDKDKVDGIVKKLVPDAVTKTIESTQYEIKSASLDETKTDELFETLKKDLGLKDDSLISQNLIGASVGKDLTKGALIALGIATVAMLIYISIRFRFDYAIAAIIAMFHDVLIMLTVFAVFNVPINTPFIAAILTVVGYSINDTIVIFDRIRENNKIYRKSTPEEIANKSIKQTMGRSIKTSITTLITIGSVTLLVPTVRDFSLPLLVGITAGALSSIFIASPVWVVLNKKLNKNK